MHTAKWYKTNVKSDKNAIYRVKCKQKTEKKSKIEKNWTLIPGTDDDDGGVDNKELQMVVRMMTRTMHSVQRYINA